MTNPNKQEQGLEGLDEKRRETLKRLGLGAAFVVPIVTSFSLDSRTIANAQAIRLDGSDIHVEDGDTVLRSDIRQKEDILPLMRFDNGIGLYRYRYKWSDQVYVGVMAQEVATIVPTAVLRGYDGYLRVDYGQLGMKLMTWDDWTAQTADTVFEQ